MNILLSVAALTVLISALCSFFESTLYSTRIGALEAAIAEGKHKSLAQRFLNFKKDIAIPTSAILILNTVANTAGATLCGMYAAQVLGPQMVPAFSVVLTLAILFVGEILPKTYGATHWKTIWHLIVWPLTGMQIGLKPIVIVTHKFANFFTGVSAVPGVTEDEVQATIRMGAKSGELSPAELQLLNAVFHFDEMVTRQVMVPRREVAFFDVSWPLDKCLEIVRKTQHTRFPLCKGSLDQVVGLIHVKDLLGLSPDEPLDLTSIARPLRHIPGTLPISRLLREMQSVRQHMAIVDDEYGTVVGIITLENVLEQIVGAVQDEFDTETPEIVPDGPDCYKVQGHVPIDRINRELSLDLYSHGVDSISGLIVSKLNRLLGPGDKVWLDGAVAEVLEAQAGRATLIRLTLTKSDVPYGNNTSEPEEQGSDASS